jgi:hypothetical protein
MTSLLKSPRVWVAVVTVSLVLGLVGLWLLPQVPPRLRNRALNFNWQDRRLVDRVLWAEELQLPPGKVESFVGTPATINTLRPRDRLTLRFADLCEDEREGGKQNLALLHAGLDDGSVRHAMYWIRPTEARNPRLIGLLWTQGGKAWVFFGVVLPPG